MDHMERRQNEELMEARRLRRQEQKRKLLMRQRVLAAVLLVFTNWVKPTKKWHPIIFIGISAVIGIDCYNIALL